MSQSQREWCVPTAVLAAARSDRERLALAGPDGEFTYGEMDLGSQVLASALAKEGLSHGELVGLLTPRSARAIVAMMGILRAGGAYVHLDPTLPAERLAFIVEDAGLRAIVADPRSADLVAHPTIDMVEATEGREIGWEDSRLDPEQLMYVMYTSGSTGGPKGVAVQHSAVANLVRWELQDFAIVSDDRSSEVSNFTFDASILEIWPYLCAGASVHVAPESVRMFPHALRRWLTEKRITTAWLTSPLAEELLELGLPSDTALRLLVTGGDRLHTRPTSDFPARVVNVYGPTETTVIATAGDVEARDVSDSLPAIGAPIANVRLYAVDDDGRQVPDGEPGELWIAGRGVSRGYLNRPDLSAERFPPDPFEPRSGRIYRSGDIVRKLPDGRYEFVGRADGQVKLRGLRIEIGEIEARLLEHPDVARASVVLIGERDERELVAYVQPVEDSVDDEDLLDHLARWLPYYMVPERLVQVDALGVTANGKIDRRNLIARQQPR